MITLFSYRSLMLSFYAPCCAHGIVENRAKGHSNDTSAFGRVSPLWGSCDNVIEHLKHVMIVANLFGACGIVPIRSLVWDFFEHLSEIHIHS